MLYFLAEHFSSYGGIFNVLTYITFRAMTAFVLSFLLVLIFEPRFIQWFRARYLGQPIRQDGPQTHLSKKGTPTMGGLVIIAAVLFSTLLLANLSVLYIWVVMGVTASYGGLGYLDDYLKVSGQDPKGVRARTKLYWQFGTALAAVLILTFFTREFSFALNIPYTKGLSIELGWLYVPLAVLVIVGASNAVNLTDGLDGLVIGPVVTTACVYGVFAYILGHSQLAKDLQFTSIPGAGDLAIYAAALCAAGLGFLWFNSFPAQVFMGDVGALALGGALGTIAVIVKQELLLIIAGGVFVVEALSVITQVASFKLRGKRIFRMAPIHHHFELKGLPEPKIIVRFWIVSIILAVVTLTALKLR